MSKTRTHKNEKSNAHVRKTPPVVRASRHVAPQVNSADALAKTLTAPASDLSATDIVALQQTVGNSAVRQLLSSPTETSSTHRTSARPVIQAKLAIGPANDHFEQEADRVAKEAAGHNSGTSHETVQRQTGPLADSISPLVQHRAELQEAGPLQAKRNGLSGGFMADRRFENRLRASRGGGSRLPDRLRSRMEDHFGADFSGVRIHTDSVAMALNQEIGARAFTHGKDIYFRGGAIDSDSNRGKQLLAHELTHVVQQGAAGKVGVRAQRKTASTSGEQVIQRNGEDQEVSWWRHPIDYLSGKKQKAYDPLQGRQKPALVAAGVSGLGSAALGGAGLAELIGSAPGAMAGGGSAAGGLGAIAGPINAVSGLYNAVTADNSRQRREGGLTSVAGLGQTFSGTAVGVTSLSKLGVSPGFLSANATQFLSSAVLPAQIAMGGVDVVRGIYGFSKASSRQNELKNQSRRIKRRVDSGWSRGQRDDDDRRFIQFAAKYQGKRKRTALLNQLSGAAAVVGGSLLASGVGIPLAFPLLIASGVLKAGAIFGGSIREKYINAKRTVAGWFGEKKQSYTDEKKAKEDAWVEYASQGISRGNQEVQETLMHMGIHGGTFDRIRAERDVTKRKAILRSLLMRR